MKNTNTNTMASESIKAQFYLFAMRLTEELNKKNAHDQLYSSLKSLGSEWYQPAKDEDRRIQFVQIGSLLACRSTVKPEGVDFALIEVKASAGDSLDIKVRLPMMHRYRDENGAKYMPIKKEDKVKLYTELLERNGMKVESLAWRGAFDETIYFTKKKNKVAIPVDDIKALVRIEDADKFSHSLLHGIGRCKTYGCGMISIIDKVGG